MNNIDSQCPRCSGTGYVAVKCDYCRAEKATCGECKGTGNISGREVVMSTQDNELSRDIKPIHTRFDALREELKDYENSELREKIREVSLFPIRDINNGVVDPPGLWGLTNGQLDKVEQLFNSHTQQIALEARLRGAVDCSTFVMQHDQASFRQERAWFKIKPKWLIDYQVKLMEELSSLKQAQNGKAE